MPESLLRGLVVKYQQAGGTASYRGGFEMAYMAAELHLLGIGGKTPAFPSRSG